MEGGRNEEKTETTIVESFALLYFKVGFYYDPYKVNQYSNEIPLVMITS